MSDHHTDTTTSGDPMTAPDRIWVAPTHRSNGVDDFYLLDPKFRGNRGTEYVRKDIAAEQVQEAYERAAQILDNYGKRYFRADDADIEALANAIRDLKSDDTNEAAGLPPAPDAVARLVEAARALQPYLDWTIGPESPGYHPTMASAAAAFKEALAAMEASHDRT